MSDEHKAALAEGRAESRVVKTYLEALDENRPRRGRKRTRESILNRLGVIESEIGTAAPLKRLSLIQERIDLNAELQAPEKVVDLAGPEKAFIKVAKSYGARKGVSYAAWRELGVSAAVLKRAGVTRSS